jgi:hypothetical protein
MVARPFIVFRDLVRVVSPKTPFSDWGQFLGRIWTVPQESQTARDVFNALFLGFSGAIALFMYILRSKGLQPASGSHFPRALWVLLTFGFIWAAIDEVQMIHEFLGPNLPLLRSARITKYPDDIIVFAYLAAAVVVFLRYYRFLVARKEPFLLLASGAILQGLAAINGLPGLELSEESYEFYGGLCYMTAILWYASREIEESLTHN